MLTRRRLMKAAALLTLCTDLPSPASSVETLAPQALRLSQFLDRLDVEDHWIAGQHIDWQTGDPDGRGEALPGRHTHCSAFVAAAAARLGIYILRPPEHGQVLLANAQNEWLPGPGRNGGWRQLPDPLDHDVFRSKRSQDINVIDCNEVEHDVTQKTVPTFWHHALAAQQSANASLFVVASYRNHVDTKPGHIAIVRPSRKPDRQVADEGPDVIQAGTTNATRTSLRDGFAGHPHAWNDSEVDYFAHEIP